MPFAHAYHIAEHAAAFGGKLGILMVAAKKPLVVGQLQQNFIQKAVQLVGLAAGKGGKIQKSAWRIVGQHIIHFVIARCKVLLTKGVFLLRRHFFPPPVHTGFPILHILAFRTAKAQVFFILQFQHTAAAHMVHIATQCLHLPAKAFLGGILL